MLTEGQYHWNLSIRVLWQCWYLCQSSCYGNADIYVSPRATLKSCITAYNMQVENP